MIILKSIIGWLEQKNNPQPPDIEKSRPDLCPLCKQTVRENGILWIIGHGTYRRWAYTPAAIQVFIRRFLCKNCRKTITVSPHWLLPYYQYTTVVILSCLKKYFLEQKTAKEATAELNVNQDKQRWGLLYRWGKGFSHRLPLWSWLRPLLGIPHEEKYSREKLRIYVERFFRHFQDRCEPGKTPDIYQIIQLSFAERRFDRHETGVLYHIESGGQSSLIPQKARFSPHTNHKGLTRAPP
jgi:hypothetical protein